MLFSALSVQSAAYASGRKFALDRLQTIQKTKGYIPKQTAAVTGNCYGFVSSVCGKLYGVQYNGEGLYNSYKCRHSSGNYKTVSTYTNKNSTLTRSDADKIISFFVDNAVTGDIVHFGALQKQIRTHLWCKVSITKNGYLPFKLCLKGQHLKHMPF